MTSFFRLAAIAVFFSVLSACAITPERHREARLMPEKVALQIVARYVGESWAQNPRSAGALANHPLCNDQTAYPMPYETMKVTWDPWFVEVWGDRKVGFWCGTSLMVRFKVSDTQAQDDLIDALTSLGAKIKVE